MVLRDYTAIFKKLKLDSVLRKIHSNKRLEIFIEGEKWHISTYNATVALNMLEYTSINNMPVSSMVEFMDVIKITIYDDFNKTYRLLDLLYKHVSNSIPIVVYHNGYKIIFENSESAIMALKDLILKSTVMQYDLDKGIFYL